MDKRKRMFYTDAALVPLFLLTLVMGLALHGAGHAPGHADRQFWALFHLVSGAAFTLAGLLHVGMHWGWYRTLAKGVGSKSRLTLLLSLLFAVAVATGIGLLLSRGGQPCPIPASRGGTSPGRSPASGAYARRRHPCRRFFVHGALQCRRILCRFVISK